MAMQVALITWSCLTLLLLALAAKGHRTFNRCSLARQLNNLDVPRNQLARWVCIAEHESSYNTDAVGQPNDDGSRDYGLFQINDKYWCQPSNGNFSHNGCNIMCDTLLTDHIDAAVRCAQKIKRKQGWTAWTVYNRYCDGHLPSIEDCFGGQSNSMCAANMHGKW